MEEIGSSNMINKKKNGAQNQIYMAIIYQRNPRNQERTKTELSMKASQSVIIPLEVERITIPIPPKILVIH